MYSIPGEHGAGLRFRAEFFDASRQQQHEHLNPRGQQQEAAGAEQRGGSGGNDSASGKSDSGVGGSR